MDPKKFDWFVNQLIHLAVILGVLVILGSIARLFI